MICSDIQLFHTLHEATNKTVLFYSAFVLQISSLQSQIHSQESDHRSQEDEMSRTKMDLSRLQDEEAMLEQSLLSGRVQLDSITKSLKTTQEEINQVSTDGATTAHRDQFLPESSMIKSVFKL